MNYTELTINGETYKLRLNTRNLISLERTLGYNPVDILFQLEKQEIPKVADIVAILHASLQPYNHGIKADEAYDIFDAYVADGGSIFSFVSDAIVPLYQNCGLLTQDDEPEEKN